MPRAGYYRLGAPDKVYADELAGFVAAGFRAVKLKTGGGTVAEEAKRVRAVREAIGKDVSLMLDMNAPYDIDACIAFARGRTAGRFLAGGAPAMVPPARGLPAACPGDADPARARRARAHPFHRARLHRLRRDPLRAVRRDGLRGASPRRCESRSSLNYSVQHLDDARQALTRLYTALKAVPAQAGNLDWSEPHAARFRAAMNDDFNTPEAVAVLFDLANEVNRTQSSTAVTLLKSLAAVLGLLQRNPADFLQGVRQPETGKIPIPGYAPIVHVGYSPERISQLISERNAARKAKKFKESDRIRDELLAAGIVLEDAPAGTTWRRK